MKTVDHSILAEYWLEKLQAVKNVSSPCRRAFLFGNVQPDRNFFTYFHGMTHSEKFRGHNYDNILPSMEKLCRKLRFSSGSEVKDYYLLGKLMHYVADSFTFPHNREYKGTLGEHRKYERILHERIVRRLQRDNGIVESSWAEYRSDLLGTVGKLHERYLKEERNYETDCSYILAATGILIMKKAGLPSADLLFQKKIHLSVSVGLRSDRASL